VLKISRTRELSAKLEATQNGSAIGSALVCEYRADLEAIGSNRGFFAFAITTPETFDLNRLGDSPVSRATNGAAKSHGLIESTPSARVSIPTRCRFAM
jgi:hypothetical protein